jgi:hypothetical protein
MLDGDGAGIPQYLDNRQEYGCRFSEASAGAAEALMAARFLPPGLRVHRFPAKGIGT